MPQGQAGGINRNEGRGNTKTTTGHLFHALAGAHTDDAIEEIERDIAPKIAAHFSGIYLDTDVDLVQALDPLIGLPCFLGFESRPGASDLCNNIDDNCNGVIDENAITATVTPIGTVSVCSGTADTSRDKAALGMTSQWETSQ